jgi:hypothetical protein
MAEKNITQLLEQLHQELAQTEAVDDKGRELLKTLDADIQHLLGRPSGVGADDSMLERLQDTIDHFEESHPALTTVLSNLVTVLNNAGI